MKSVIIFAAAVFAADVALADARPNVVVIFIDDMGFADISAFGNPAMKTPNMDRLASEGLKFTNFYVNSPICSASRVALATGRYPQRYRIHSYFDTRRRNRQRKMPDYLPAEAFTYARLLKPQEQQFATCNASVFKPENSYGPPLPLMD